MGLILEDKDNESDDHSDNDDQSEFMGAVINKGHIAAKPNMGDPIPRWAEKKVTRDARNTIPLTKNHYMGQVLVNGTLINALMDTCGARSMVDKKTAEELGFNIEIATK
jgi:predicted aspartyl protease